MPQRLVDAAVERYGRLDIVINNAGIIQVGPVQAAQLSQNEDAVQTMALASVRLALTALPVMQRQGHGRIVTIASIGGRLGVPHLLPYSTAKFAAVRFSEGPRAEIGRSPVTVTTVVPGLMRSGARLQARCAGQAGRSSPGLRSAPACRCYRWTPSGPPGRSSRRSAASGRKQS